MPIKSMISHDLGTESTLSDPIWAPCVGCTRQTVHEVLYTTSETNEAAECTTTHEMLQCRGCLAISYKKAQEYFSGNLHVNYYPPRISRQRPIWSFWMALETDKIEDLLSEIYTATQNN